VREELIHIGLVELMYVAWTFDLQARASDDDGSVSYAEWAGPPRPAEWTARKAARRLLWHERLHTPAAW
jgi:hypothetical protein